MDFNDSNQPTRPRRRRGPKAAPDVIAAKAAFLLAYRQSGIIRVACEAAGVHRTTVWQWKEQDDTFAQQCRQAELDANDAIRAEIHRRAVQGVQEPIISNGMLVYEYEPLLDAFGEPVLDARGKPRYRRGQQIFLHKYSDALLMFEAKRRMPEYRDRQPDAPADALPPIIEVRLATAPPPLPADPFERR